MKTIAVIKYVFAAVGLGMLLGALIWYRSTSTFIQEAVIAEGTVVKLVPVRSDGSTTYRPTVRFTAAAGQVVEFSSSSSSRPPAYAVGEKVKVYYRPQEPRDAKISGFFSLWGGSLILGLMGGVFSAIGGGIFLVTFLRGHKDKQLVATGRRIDTEFQSVELNQALEVNGRNPFQIVTQWQNPATSKVHVFRGKNLWFDPSGHIKGQRITVFIDADNPKKYYMDVSFLPELAE